jgi:hypothetical protein
VAEKPLIENILLLTCREYIFLLKDMLIRVAIDSISKAPAKTNKWIVENVSLTELLNQISQFLMLRCNSHSVILIDYVD